MTTNYLSSYIKKSLPIALAALLLSGGFTSCSRSILTPWKERERPNNISEQMVESERRLKRGRAQLEGVETPKQSRMERIRIREKEAVRNFWWRYKNGDSY